MDIGKGTVANREENLTPIGAIWMRYNTSSHLCHYFVEFNTDKANRSDEIDAVMQIMLSPIVFTYTYEIIFIYW